MNEQPEFEIHWMPMELEELQKIPPNQDWNTVEFVTADLNLDDPVEVCFAAEQNKWAQERLAHSVSESFDAHFLSGVILATSRLDGNDENETPSGIHGMDDDGVLVSKWFVSGYISARLLWGRVGSSGLRFIPELAERIMAAE